MDRKSTLLVVYRRNHQNVSRTRRGQGYDPRVGEEHQGVVWEYYVQSVRRRMLLRPTRDSCRAVVCADEQLSQLQEVFLYHVMLQNSFLAETAQFSLLSFTILFEYASTRELGNYACLIRQATQLAQTKPRQKPLLCQHQTMALTGGSRGYRLSACGPALWFLSALNLALLILPLRVGSCAGPELRGPVWVRLMACSL